MTRLFVVFLAAALLPALSYGQAAERAPDAPAALAKNSAYLELGGNGGLYTINYERRFSSHLAGRVGLMVFSGQSEQPTDDELGLAVIPVMANYLAGTGSHRLELGGGFTFRASLTPFYSGHPQLWGGLSVGYSF